MDRIAIVGCGEAGSPTSPARSGPRLASSRTSGRPVRRRGLEATRQGHVCRSATRPRHRPLVDHRRELRRRPAHQVPSPRHAQLPGPARLSPPAANPAMPAPARPRPAPDDRRPQPDHLGLHRYIVSYRRTRSPHLRPDRRACRGCPGRRPAQPPCHMPLSRRRVGFPPRPGQSPTIRNAASPFPTHGDASVSTKVITRAGISLRARGDQAKIYLDVPDRMRTTRGTGDTDATYATYPGTARVHSLPVRARP
ncbi:hypothetical protein FF36_04521 [Frankia torreyi]|uniref:Uncharacterized protein n=1 Tax=Frankia torreyi TaxID=1856 RepID=A0A0D8BAF7_9ACTN|nr:hypothetical protein FF36_04521 [Frankia torreyi]